MPSSRQKRRMALRSDARDAQGNVISYLDEDGEAVDLHGDEDGPWIKIAGTLVGALVNIVGSIAHDAVDDESTNQPVKTGGHATTNVRAAVSADGDVADHSVDRSGRQRVRVSGTTAGNVLSDVPLDSAFGLVAGGSAAHGDADAGAPLKVGGRAGAEVPAAVDANDRADASFELEGRLLVNQDKLLAGENLVGDYIAIQERPSDLQQDSLEHYATAGAAESSAVVKSSPGRVYEVQVIVDAGVNADRFVHLLNQPAAPVGGETPIWRALVPANANAVEVSFDVKPGGIYHDTGIVVAVSTTHYTYTAPVAAATSLQVAFK